MDVFGKFRDRRRCSAESSRLRSLWTLPDCVASCPRTACDECRLAASVLCELQPRLEPGHLPAPLRLDVMLRARQRAVDAASALARLPRRYQGQASAAQPTDDDAAASASKKPSKKSTTRRSLPPIVRFLLFGPLPSWGMCGQAHE